MLQLNHYLIDKNKMELTTIKGGFMLFWKKSDVHV